MKRRSKSSGFAPTTGHASYEAMGRLCSFLAHSEKMNQKRGATPKAPFKGGCKKYFAETDEIFYVLATRDDALVFY